MQNETRFKIEGEIEGYGQNDAENKVRTKRKNYKPALLFFVMVSVILLGINAFLWFKLSEASKGNDNDSDEAVQAEMYADRIRRMQNEQDSLSNLVQEFKAMVARLQEFSNDSEGVFFEIQIGNFKDFDLDDYLEEMANLRQEKYDGGSKFLLGKFRSYKKALLFENDLKRMGLRDVFIKGRIDGQLTSKEEALQYLRNK